MERVLELVRADVGADRVKLDTPTQNLESYFLGVVERAKQSEETSGATSGHRVAAYLRGEADQGTSANRMLERLTLPTAEQAPEAKAAPAGPALNEARLSALSQNQPEAEVKPVVSQPTAPADLAKANEKLSGLLGGKGQ